MLKLRKYSVECRRRITVMPVIPLTCPFCGGDLQIDSNLEAAVCKFCKKPFVVKDAVFQNYINNITNINAENVNIYTQKDFVMRV